MSKNKLERFKELSAFENSFEPSYKDLAIADYYLKGKWHNEVFGNNNPIVLELGCGKGEYTVGMAEQFPKKNFIGIDIKGNRMWKGAKTALDTKMQNVRFVRTLVENISAIFGEDEISEIWLTFPDPQAKERRSKKRLSSSRFLTNYQKIMVADGIVHLKTDSQLLHDYTLQLVNYNNLSIIQQTKDLYNSNLEGSVKEIQTFYEKQFLALGMPITYLAFNLPKTKTILENPNYEQE